MRKDQVEAEQRFAEGQVKIRQGVIEQIKEYVRENADHIKPFGLYDDGSGISGIETCGCSCCSSFMRDKVGWDITQEVTSSLSMEEQKDIAFEWVSALIEHYDILDRVAEWY